MNALAENALLTETHTPETQQDLARLVGDAVSRRAAIYPFGGRTGLHYGLPATRPGMGISLAKLDRVIDYPARDMTITVEAGITMRKLADVLQAERQWLPIDASQPAAATLGGVIATAASGPRRYGYGTIRDYVIGISAIDGHGRAFKAGGRVVKNVAGYDFCKLLTGSLGTLGIITQVTLKIRPQPERSAFLVCELPDVSNAEPLLAALIHSRTTPAAIELLVGSHWQNDATLGAPVGEIGARLVVGLEGTADEVDWMLAQLAREWHELGVANSHAISGALAEHLWRELAEFSAASDSPLVVKASVVPSRGAAMVQLIRELDRQASIQAHAGNGIIVARFARFDAADVSRLLVGRLQPAAQASGGSLVVLSTTLEGLTRQAVWGGAGAAVAWMGKVKRQFDPHDLLNPGRFVYDRQGIAS